MRDLLPHELAQIAGRAGRHTNAGTFGVTGEAPPLDDGVAEAIMSHRFAPVRKLWWRNSELDFGSVARLIASLEERTDDEWLTRGREADDLMALKALSDREEVAGRIADARDVRLLWGCLPDPGFPGHQPCRTCRSVGPDLRFSPRRGAPCPTTGWRGRCGRIDRTEGDIRHAVQAAGIYPHMDLRGAAHRAGSRTKAIGAAPPVP